MQSNNQNQIIYSNKQPKSNIISQKFAGKVISDEQSTKLKQSSQRQINLNAVELQQDEKQIQQNQENNPNDDELDEGNDFDYDEFLDKNDLKFNALLNIKSSVNDGTVCKFKNSIKRDNLNGNKIMILFLILLYFISTLILITVRDIIDNILIIFALRSIFCALLLLVFIILPLSFNNPLYKQIIFIIFLYGIIPTLVQGVFTKLQDLVIIQIIEMLCIYTTFSCIVVFTFMDIIIYSLIQSCLFIGLLWQHLDLSTCFFFFVYQAFFIQKTYGYLYNLFKNFNFLSKNNFKINRIKTLTSQLLPKATLNLMRKLGNFNDKKRFTDVFEDITFLYAKIVGVNIHTEKIIDPIQFVLEIKKMFELFDSLCSKHKMFKLYNFDICYVVVNFAASKSQQSEVEKIKEVKRVINMGLDMLETINSHKATRYPFINLRIGIHTGKIIGGLIGTDFLRYDIFGKDVKIVKKIQSNGEPGKVMISQQTMDILQKEESIQYSITDGNYFRFEGKFMVCYFIQQKDSQN